MQPTTLGTGPEVDIMQSATMGRGTEVDRIQPDTLGRGTEVDRIQPDTLGRETEVDRIQPDIVHFMSGYKSHGNMLMKVSHAEHYSPELSEVNYAVPDKKVLRNVDPYDVHGERAPGIFLDIISALTDNMDLMSACLTFDGKKLKQGLQ
jgi:hypothetical protein